MTLDPASATATPPPQCFISRQRDPPDFAGLRGDDVEEWLENFERVSAYNGWDDKLKRLTVGFSLTEIAKTWYRNNAGRLPDWTTFTTEIRKIFGTSAARSEDAKKKLEARVQHPCESYTSYIEDVLALCRKVNKDMSESDRVRQILKGINQFAFTALALQNPRTVSDVTTTCQRLDDLQSIRIQQDTSATRLGDEDLRVLIRQLIREELDGRASVCASAPAHHSASTNLRQIIKEELACVPGRSVPDLCTPYAVPSYSEVAGRPPLPMAPVTSQPLPGYVATINHAIRPQPYYRTWGPPSPERPPNRPVCFYCGIRGHIARFCRRRAQDERRGYDTYERDVTSPRYGYRQRGYQSPTRQTPPPADSPGIQRNSRDQRRRSPSPFRRSVSPLRPVVHDSARLSEN